MAQTLNELARRIMLEQSVLQAGEQPSPQQAADINAKQSSIHAELLDNQLIDWALTDIPLRCEDAWIVYMAGECAGLFGLSSDPAIPVRAADAFERLVALSAQPDDPRDIPVTDY